MKKTVIALLILLLLALGAFLFRDALMDLLPIDQSKWAEEGGARFHIGRKGDPDTGWFREDGNTYYLNPAAVTGWMEIDSKTYHFGADGSMDTQWLTEQGKTYFLGNDGAMRTGWTDIENTRYYFAEDGALCTGWVDTESGRYYLNAEGIPLTGTAEIAGQTYYFAEDGRVCTGWIEVEGQRLYLDENGLPHSGWLETAEGRYYLQPDGSIYTGWLNDGDATYYLLEDGSAATGRVEIDGRNEFFTASGNHILLVNRWNPVPEDYKPDLVKSSYGCYVDRSCLEATEEMLTACFNAGHRFQILSAYRSYWDQMVIYREIQAQTPGSLRAALPGTSEHELGLALDIVESTADGNRRYINPTQQWFAEHCWDYGFILRYPEGDTAYTGIISEPWHFRYVGLPFSLEMKEAGLCLEQYMDQLTGDGISCGGIDK